MEGSIKCQMKSGAYSDTPFLVVTAALLQSIIPIAIGQQWSLFNRFKSNRTTTTKSVNAEETVRQASRASATPMKWTVFPGPWRVDGKGITYIRCSNYSFL